MNKRAFGLLQVTNALSGVSNGVVMITVPWLVLERTGSPAQAGLLAALVSLPGIFVSPVIGGLIDRVGRRAVSALSDIFSCVSVLLFVVGELTTELSYIFIASFAVLGAVFDPAGYTARKALIPNAAESSGMAVDKANGRHEGFFAIGWMLGPALGAWCISAGGPILAFAGTSALFLVAALAVRSMRIREHHEPRSESSEGFVQSLRGGWTLLRSDRALLTFTLGLTVMGGLYMPIDTVIWPTHFQSLDNAVGLGIVMSSVAGAEPVIMLTAPAPASKKCLDRAGMTTKDIDLWEINEAFAAIPLRAMRELGITNENVNVNGGAIALGHPIGGSGPMLMQTALDELERQDKQTALITMCTGGGMGTATIIERM